MGKQIEVIVDNKTLTIDSDTPNFDELVSLVIEKKEYDFNKISVKCEEETFDSQLFKNALVNVIASVIQDLQVQKTQLDKLMGEISKNKDTMEKPRE